MRSAQGSQRQIVPLPLNSTMMKNKDASGMKHCLLSMKEQTFYVSFDNHNENELCLIISSHTVMFAITDSDLIG